MAVAIQEKALQRRVPNGKVYRQIFDAEVKLVHSLDKTRSELSTRLQLPPCSSIPVLRPAVTEPGCGMLTERQLTWMQEFPNESATENPVLYKFYADQVDERIKQHEAESLPKADVLGLPDILVPAKNGSDIIERISSNRKLRHDAALDDMHHELTLISCEMEPVIENHCEDLIQRLEDNNSELDSLMAGISSDEVLVNFTYDQLESVWSKISAHIQTRCVWIAELDEVLMSVEENRVEKMRQVFKQSWKMLEKISYLPVPDLQRMLDKDCQLINQIVLNNKRMYANLKNKLLLNNIDREHKLLTVWRKRVNTWKQLQIERAISSFMVYMESDDVVRSRRINELMQELTSQRLQLNQQRIQLVNSLRQVSPPALCVEFIKKWHQEILALSKKIDEVNQAFFSKLCLEYEYICQTCLGEVMNLKVDLVRRHVCSDVEASDLANKRCLPVVGERQSAFEKTLEAMDKATEEQSASALKQLKRLFSFGQAVGHLWDTHQVCLARLDKTLEEKLDLLRTQHDATNQERESALDAIVDRMRQEATDGALRDSLAKAIQMLATIRFGYDEFFAQQIAAVEVYPQSVQAEIKLYASDICSFFGLVQAEENTAPEVDKNQQMSTRNGAVAPSIQTLIEMLGSDEIVTDDGTVYKVANPNSSDVQSLPKPKVSSTQAVSADTESEKLQSSTFITEVSVSTDVDSSVKTIAVEEDLIIEVCRALRLKVLTHFDAWSKESEHKSAVVVDTKTTELKSELDLRIHLHEPRARRTELDVHNVRAAELAMHSERVSRHINGVEQTLVELRQTLRSTTDNLQQRVELFRSDVENFEKQFNAARKSSRLTELKGDLSKLQAGVMMEARDSVERFNKHLQETLKNLRTSTSEFLQCFKLFADGGNFCQSEVTEYSKRLEKASQKIDAMEQQLLAELKIVEPKLSDQAAKIVQSFEVRFQNDMSDLVFVEKVARWLSNCQVKIKTEVAESNAQSQKIEQSLVELERLIIGCEAPSLDNGFVKPEQVVEALLPLFNLVSWRSIFLRCLKEDNSSPALNLQSAEKQQTVPATSVSDGLAARTIADNGIPPNSKPGGKSPADDMSIVTIRQILKTQKVCAKAEGQDVEGNVKSESMDSLAMISTSGNMAGKKQSQAKDGKSKGAGSADVQKRGQQGKATGGVGAGKNKMDAKFFVFGEVAESDESTYFAGRIRAIVRDTLSAILATAEGSYKQKGLRLTTKPDLMQDSLEQCAETVIQKLQSYVAQSDTYHNSCVHEFRRQLDKLESLAQRVPRCVARNILSTAVNDSESEQNHHLALFGGLKDHLDSLRVSHDNTLRPSLGHPEQLSVLSDLCQEEEERHTRMLNAIADVTKKRKDAVQQRGRTFADALVQSSNQLLLLFDQMVTVSEVITGKVEPVRLTPCELVRRKKCGQPLESEPITGTVTVSGPTTWPELPINELAQPAPAAAASSHGSIASKPSSKANLSKKQSQSTVVTTAKATGAHRACISARDEVFEEFKRYFESSLQKIDAENDRLNVTETRWTEHWRTAVGKVKQLY